MRLKSIHYKRKIENDIYIFKSWLLRQPLVLTSHPAIIGHYVLRWKPWWCKTKRNERIHQFLSHRCRCAVLSGLCRLLVTRGFVLLPFAPTYSCFYSWFSSWSSYAWPYWFEYFLYLTWVCWYQTLEIEAVHVSVNGIMTFKSHSICLANWLVFWDDLKPRHICDIARFALITLIWLKIMVSIYKNIIEIILKHFIMNLYIDMSLYI